MKPPPLSHLSLQKRTFLFRQLAQAFPVAETELTYTNPFTFLVAVVLSARMTDKGVNKATPPLFQVADTPQSMVELGEEGLISYIKSIGLYKTKARHIMALSHQLIECYQGQVPNTREALESLPGVGRKSANVVLGTIFGKDTFPVDTHVARVSARTGLVTAPYTKTPKSIEGALEKVVPKSFRFVAHHLLVLHGRYTCIARRPKCEECPIASVCWRLQHPELALA